MKTPILGDAKCLPLFAPVWLRFSSEVRPNRRHAINLESQVSIFVFTFSSSVNILWAFLVARLSPGHSGVTKPTPFVTLISGKIGVDFAGFRSGVFAPLLSHPAWPVSARRAGVLDRLLPEDSLDGGRRDVVGPCDLADALSTLPIYIDSPRVQLQPVPPDLAAFEFRAAHAGFDSLDDQVAFEFRDRADDDGDGPAEGAAGVDVLPEAGILDLQPAELIQNLKEVLDRPGDPVRSPDQDNVEPAAAGISHHLIQTGPLCLRAADSVGILLDDFEAALNGHLTQIKELGLGVLIQGGNSHIEGGALHRGWIHCIRYI